MDGVIPKRTVLVVDDQEINRKILVKQLENEYNVLCASNGVEALEIIEREQDRLSGVLLDIVMPVLDGYGVLKQVRETDAIANLPVLVTSQKDGDISELRALNLGASDFISKPYSGAILKRRLSNLIQMHEAAKRINALERDELTGLYTKVAFAERVAERLRKERNVKWNMIALDIDHFKLVNDSYGTHIGDELLRFLAKKLSEYEKNKRCICARSYADKFFLLVERRDVSYIKMRHAELTKYIHDFPVDMKLVIKFGVYEINDILLEVDSMCDRAIFAANQVKGQYVKDISFYDDSIRRQMVMEQRITDEMEHALQEKQFKVYFQPKYDIYSETLSGAEALVRWIHPQNGFMSPGDFIPIFERNGFITEVDMFVWDRTCEKIREWLDKYDCYVPVSVNVSRKDIYKPNLPDILIDIVHKHGLEPKHLHLEITESAYVENSDQLLNVVEQLKEAGFTIEMDDFGSGYSSLNMLADMPIDMLKLDMKFVQNYSEDNNTRSIISFVIGLAKWMNLYVIAEGVETKEQLDLLRGMDCNLAQGYYFSKPLPEDEFEKILRESGRNMLNAPEQVIGVSAVHDTKYPTMMVVDSLAINRAMLTECFRNSYSVVEVTNGGAALQYLKHVKRADIVVMDSHLPDMHATEVIRKMKKDPLLERIPVIVTTHGSDDTINKVLSAGADAYIIKPYSRESIHECLSRVMSMVGERMRHEEQEILSKMRMMEMLTTKDYLTGLWNRVELEKRISDHVIHSAEREFYYISIDIDGYQTLVKNNGYAMGDRILQIVAERISKCFRDTDVVGRISGDKFAVFMNAEIDAEELNVRMTHLQASLAFELEGIPVTCSCGVSQYPGCGKDFDALHCAAEKALEEAKKAGKNCFRISKFCK